MAKALLIPAACLAGLLAGCPSKPPPQITFNTPLAYLQDAPEPPLRGRTNRNLAEHAVEPREASLRRSNLDKLALRDWLADREAP